MRKKRATQKRSSAAQRNGAVNIAGAFLVLQTAGLAWLAFLTYPTGASIDPQTDNYLFIQLNRFLPTIVFSLLAFIGLLVYVDFLRLIPNAWVKAIAVQGMILVVGFVYYFSSQPFFTYIQMVYAIFMVIYLHNHDIQVSFTHKPPLPRSAEYGRRPRF